MSGKIELLDCTLRDGAYIVNGDFGAPAIRGIIAQLQNAGTDIIECGWLKNSPHKHGTTYFQSPADLESYFTNRQPNLTYVAMIDWDRYDTAFLPVCDHRSVDAIRVVFPKGRHREAIQIGDVIRSKGYRLFFQAANTLSYTTDELMSLADDMNDAMPESLSIVDTFGAMFPEDLDRIIEVLDGRLNPEIKLGFHSHNNQQLSFALSMHFVEVLLPRARRIVVDASLCGMGRGAGNTTTELLAGYLNRRQDCHYDLNQILDAIDIYMEYFIKNYTWGYSTPYFLSGMYCAHVNNIAYLLENHRTNAKDMKKIFESLTAEERLHYDYDLLEQKYLDYHARRIDDQRVIDDLRIAVGSRSVLMLCSGRTLRTEQTAVQAYIQRETPFVIGINAIFPEYTYDCGFFSNKVRYAYAMTSDEQRFGDTYKLVTSNIKSEPSENERILDFNALIKRGWKFFDNAGILCLRLLHRIGVKKVALAGFDGFGYRFSDNYADQRMPSVNADNDWDAVNRDIFDMMRDFRTSTDPDMEISFITNSIFQKDCL